METCTSIIIIFLVLIVIFQLAELKGKITGASGEIPDSVIQNIDKIIKQVSGIIK